VGRVEASVGSPPVTDVEEAAGEEDMAEGKRVRFRVAAVATVAANSLSRWSTSCTFVCMCACMHVCTHACMYACMHVCMYAYMYVCMHACIYTYMYVCMHVYTHTHTQYI